jgi:energy-coupling factor transporter ATP-binding protein EcfA2
MAISNIPPKELIHRFFLLGSFRLGLYALQGLIFALKQTLCGLAKMMTAIDRDFNSFCRVVDFEMFGTAHQVHHQPVYEAQSEPDIFDPFAALLHKHVLIIGETGSGKSTLATWLAYSIGGRVTVYEPEGTPGDWSGLEVIGRGEDWDGIDAAMQFDLDLLSQRVADRLERGDIAMHDAHRVLIAEEYPEMKEKCSSAQEWLERHARRGRKLNQFLILISQFDRVAAWGLEGKSDLADCFIKIRLGKFAMAHAKRLKSPELMEWLGQSKSHCLADDEPIKLPGIDEMKRASHRFLPVSQSLHNSFSGSMVKPEGEETRSERELWIEGFEEGLSDYAILRHKSGISGGSRFQKKKKEIQSARAAWETAQLVN